jgi:hypothetical protein
MDGFDDRVQEVTLRGARGKARFDDYLKRTAPRALLVLPSCGRALGDFSRGLLTELPGGLSRGRRLRLERNQVDSEHVGEFRRVQYAPDGCWIRSSPSPARTAEIFTFI